MLHVYILQPVVEARENVSVVTLRLGLVFAAFADKLGKFGFGSLLLFGLGHGLSNFSHQMSFSVYFI